MKEKIATKSLDLFSRYGIKWVSMNYISHELGISKKTLYGEFSSKDELVAETIEMSLAQMWCKIEKIENESVSNVKTILQISIVIYQHITSFCNAFYADLHYYPIASEKLYKAQEQLQEIYNQHFCDGVEEGVFIEGENYSLIASLYTELLSCNRPQFQAGMIQTLLRGVCTEKGCDELRNYRTLTHCIINQTQYSFKHG